MDSKSKRQIWIGTIVSILLVIILGWISLTQMQQLFHLTTQLYEHPLMVSRALLHIESDIVSMHRSMKDVAQAEQEIDRLAALEDVNQHREHVFEDFAVVQEKYLGDHGDVETAYQLFLDWEVIRSKVIELSRADQSLEAMRITRGEGSNHVDKMTRALHPMIVFAEDKAQEFLRESERQRNRSLLLTAFVVLIIAIATGIVFSRTLHLIRSSQQRLAGFMASATDGFVIVDEDLNIVDLNDESAEIFNLDKATAVGTNISEISPDVKESGRYAAYEDVLRTGTPFFASDLVLHPTLGSKHLELKAFKMGTGLGFIIADVTERNLAQEAIRKSEEKLRFLFENMTSGFALHKMVTDEEGHPIDYVFLEINDAFENLTGIQREKAIGRKVTEVLPGIENDPADWIARYGKVALTGERISFDQYAEPLDRWYSVKAYSPGDEQFVTIFDDVTDRILAAKELETALEKAQEGERIKSQFITNMSHEIRTPLNSIMGFTELLHESLSDRIKEEERSYLDQIKGSSSRLGHTVEEILNISQIEAGSLGIEPSSTNLSDAARAVYKQFIPIADSRGIKLSFSSELEDDTVFVDEFYLHQALSNLIDNALKYTEKGSVEVSVRSLGGDKVVMIQDTGIGISEEYMEYLFEPFTQESEGFSKAYQGIGLGMTLTKRYLELNKLDIIYDSEKGKGTTVKVIFPEHV